MMKKTPSIVFLEYDLRGILDTLFTSKIQQLLFNQVVDNLQKSIKANKKEVVICNIDQIEASVVVSSDNFIPILKASLEYFIKVEDYSRCTQISKLINDLENG
jgi:hypothetical protein